MRLCKAFANGSSAKIKFSKSQLTKMMQSRGFIELMDKMFGPAISVALEVPGIINSIDKGKNIPKVVLDAGCNLKINEVNITTKLSILLRG